MRQTEKKSEKFNEDCTLAADVALKAANAMTKFKVVAHYGVEVCCGKFNSWISLKAPASVARVSTVA